MASQTSMVQVKELSPRSVKIQELANPVPKPSLRTLLIAATVVLVLGWSVQGAEFSIVGFIGGIPNIVGYVSRMWPPDFTNMERIVRLLLETLQIAVVGTVLGSLGSLVLSLFAANNISSRPIYLAARGILNALRSVPELVYALVFVAAVGLGPFPGTLALAVGALGTMSKLYAETFEAIDPGPVEAMRAVGARQPQIIAFAMLPQAMPLLASYTLLLWEGNVRHATILGLVGAGGIGLELTTAMRMFDYGYLLAIVICIVVAVTLIDRLSAYLRARLV